MSGEPPRRRDVMPRPQQRRRVLALGLWLLVLFAPIGAGQPVAGGEPPPVTAETLEAKIAVTEAAADRSEETKTRLLSLYRRASSNLEAAAADRAAGQAFRESLQEAPAEARAIRERLTASGGADSADPLPAGLPVGERTPLAELETFIQQDRGDLALTEQLLADLSRQLDEATARPAAIRQRLQAAEQEQTENLAQQQLVAASGEASSEARARRWSLEGQADALAAEIERLNQELLSQPARVELLEAKRDKAAQDAAAIGRRLAHLEELITQRRQADREDGEAVVEVFAKCSLFDHGSEVSIGGCHPPRVGAKGSRSSHALERALLEGAKELCLKRGLELTHLVEKERPTLGKLESTTPPRVRPCERAFFVPKELALEQGV